MDVKIEDSWKKVLEPEFEKPYFTTLVNFIKSEINQGKEIFPPGNLIFNAFYQTPFDKLKVVILGQDPYHGKGQANGLAFSVSDGVKPPPSLVNIFKELNSDLGVPIPNTGNLEPWAKQGVFLLNAVLTVEKGQPASHSKSGWETFTDSVIKTISDKKQGVVFILWGNFARQKKSLIDLSKHFVIESAHPSPFSVTKFFGSKPFSKTNAILKSENIQEINWAL